MEEITPTTLGTPIDDLSRFLDNCRNSGYPFDEVDMPADFYAQLTPDQIAWAEEKFHCKLRPVKPIVFKSRPKLQLSKEEIFKTSSPKEYGMSLTKRRKKR